MKLEEVNKLNISKASKSELYALRLRAIQLHEKYKEVEKRESLVKIDWDNFYKNYKLITSEFDKRSYNFTRRSIDKILEKEKYFGIKIIEKKSTGVGNCFAILAQIGKNNILINPDVKKEQVSENIDGVIITKSWLPSNWQKDKNYLSSAPIYAIGRAYDDIRFDNKHLFIKSLKIGRDEVLIHPIKITHKHKTPTIGLRINKKDTKLSVLPKFLSLTKGTKDLIKGTVWICEIEKYDEDNKEREVLSFLSLIDIAKELKPKKIFIINMNKDLLKHEEEINTELKKWQGRVLHDGDSLEQDEIMRGIVWEMNEVEKNISSDNIFNNLVEFNKGRSIAEVNFNGIRARIEKKEKDISIMTSPKTANRSPLISKSLPLQIDEIKSFKDDFIGDANIVLVNDENNECLGEEAIEEFLSKKSDMVAIGKKVHIFVSDLLQLNGKNISGWPLEKRKKMMNYFGNREHVHFVKPIADTDNNSLSYVVSTDNREEVKKIFDSIMRVSDEGKFYPKNIAKGIVIKCLDCPYIAKKINISKPETTEKYHRIPVTDCKVTATVTLSESKGIKALYCGDSKQIATYLFDVNKWTMETAKVWISEQDKKEATKQDDSFNCKCTECGKEISSAVECAEVNCPDCGSNMRTKGSPPTEKTEKAEIFECECIECGHKIKSKEHCVNLKCPECGKQMRRADRPGTGKPEDNLKKSEVKFDFKKVDNTEYIVGGVVYPSREVDSQGHFAVQTEVWKALKKYMIEKKHIKIMHKGIARSVPIIESYLVEEDHHKGGKGDQFLLSKGDWWIAVYLGDKQNLDVWTDVKSGKLTGFSMAGRANQKDAYI